MTTDTALAAPTEASTASLGSRVRTSVEVLVFGALPVALTASTLAKPGRGWDFRVFYLAGQAYLDGRSPYPHAATHAAVAAKNAFVYPAPAAAAFAPFAALPYGVAFGLWLTLSIVAIPAAVRILGVTDWRCMGALFLTAPVRDGLRLGTIMPVLLLLVALLWHYRNSAVRAAVLAAAAGVAKLVLLPLVVWLAATRRFRAAALAALIGAACVAAAWAAIGFGGFESYPALVRTLAAFEQTFSWSVTSLGIYAGLGAGDATALAIGAGVLLLTLAVVHGRDESLAFRLALAASFVVSPIVWGHYYVLLAAPLALRRPRLSLVWLAAGWISADTLAVHDRTLWTFAALLVLALQLDLLPFVTRQQTRPVAGV